MSATGGVAMRVLTRNHVVEGTYPGDIEKLEDDWDVELMSQDALAANGFVLRNTSVRRLTGAAEPSRSAWTAVPMDAVIVGLVLDEPSAAAVIAKIEGDRPSFGARARAGAYVVSGLLLPTAPIETEPDRRGFLSFPRLLLVKDVRVECTLQGAAFQHDSAPLGLLRMTGEVDAVEPLG